MSKIGEQEIIIEEGVTVEKEGSILTVTGTLGEMIINIPENIDVIVKNGTVNVSPKNMTKQARSNHGTYRMLIHNAVHGVKEGYTKTLEFVGVGYRARMEGNTLVMSLGWNHPVKVECIEGIQIEVPEETKVVIKGHDKQKVGLFAAKIREIRKPEPYKGKGIRYEGEYVRRKSSKANLAKE